MGPRNGVIDEARGMVGGVHDRLDRIVELLQTTDHYYKYVNGSGAAAANGQFILTFTPPPGVDWLAKKIVAAGSTTIQSAQTAVTISIGSALGPNRVEYGQLDSNGVLVRGPGSPLFYVPGGTPLIVTFFSQLAGVICEFNMLVEEVARA